MPSILLVEDHKLVAQVLSNILRQRGGYDVVAVLRSGEEALSLLSGFQVDLILVDVSLPGMSGIDFVQMVRERHPDVPCLMISGHAASRYVNKSLEAGARGYVLKDDMEGIVEGVQRVLEGGTYLSKQLQKKFG